jgi:hypothetical protein
MEMIDWENKPIMMKDDDDEAKLYFENLVKDFKTCRQNSGISLVKQGYKSTNMAANVGKKLQKNISKKLQAQQ